MFNPYNNVPPALRLKGTRDKLFAFTLAEVLITLGIIGVVAAMTIPTLIANNQKTQYVTALKKAYTEFNQVLLQMASDTGCTGDLKCTGFFDTGATQDILGSEIIKYIKISKNCGTLLNQKCLPSINVEYKGLNPALKYNFDADPWGSQYKFITADGMSVAIKNKSDYCASYNDSTAKNSMKEVCGYILIDVNGFKPPNCYARDVFTFYITNGKGPLLYPSGGADDNNKGPWQSSLCGPGSTDTTGQSFCTGRILEENWQMNY